MLLVQPIRLANKLLQCRVFCCGFPMKSSLSYCKNRYDKVNSTIGLMTNEKLILSEFLQTKVCVRFLHCNGCLHSYTADKSSVKNQTVTKQSQFWRLLHLVKPEAASVAGAVCLLSVSSAVTLSVPFLMGKLIDIIQEASLNSNSLQDTLHPMLTLLSFVYCIGALANAGRIYLLQMSGQRIMKNLRQNAFSSIVSQEIAFFDKTRTGELINRLASDADLVSGAVTQNVSDGLRAIAQVTVGVSMMFYMSYDLAKVILMVVPPVAVASVSYGRYLRRLTSQTQTILAESAEHAEEKISGIRTVRAFAKEENECESYAEKMTGVLNVVRKESMARAWFFGLTGLAGNAIVLLVLYNGGLMMQSGHLTVGNLSAFVLYSGYVAMSINGLSNFYSSINKAIGASDRLWDLMDRTPLIPLTDGITPDSALMDRNIYFDHVQFSYASRKNQPVFTDLDLEIKAGKVTAIVGPSGCGKSTIASLLLRLYEPGVGKIVIGDTGLNRINPQWLRSQIGTVSQEPTLFSTSIYNNIAYGTTDTDVTLNDVEEAARKANAFDFINDLPDKFETHVGERGVTLSGGQRQRVAIARALIKNPRILLLDEATSALDATSEYLVQDALEKVSIGRTTIVIAHRLSTVRDAHVIVVLDRDGIVQEKGSYDQLMEIEEGYFKQLVAKQALLS